MSIEIERKFIVNENWQAPTGGVAIVQGYLSLEPTCCIRVRKQEDAAWLTIKGETKGISRQEFEYEIPLDHSAKLLSLCKGSLIEKKRYSFAEGDHTWEIDVFTGENTGLVIAEIELGDEAEAFSRPSWVGREVSEDSRYYNLQLAMHPFSRW